MTGNHAKHSLARRSSMANNSKSKLQITNGKGSKVKLGASTSSKAESSPLMPKKSYKKKGSEATDFGAMPGFGTTGLESESK